MTTHHHAITIPSLRKSICRDIEYYVCLRDCLCLQACSNAGDCSLCGGHWDAVMAGTYTHTPQSSPQLGMALRDCL